MFTFEGIFATGYGWLARQKGNGIFSFVESVRIKGGEMFQRIMGDEC